MQDVIIREQRTANRRLLRLAAALMLGTAASAVAVTPAEAQVADASLRGRIALPSGSTIREVSATELATGYRRTAEVLRDGTYNFASLRPGTYRLDVQTSVGKKSTDAFTLSVGQAAVLDFDFAGTATAKDAVIVTGARLKSMEAGEVGSTISQRQIEQLPQNNRNFLAFADLAPGVQFITGSNGQSRLQGGAQDSRTVNVFIDGVGQKDYVLKNGITGQDSTQGNPFPQLAVGEYRVISSNYKAEFDQVSSTAITAVTKSGTNQFHGQGFIDYTDQHLRYATPLEKQGTTGKTKTKDFQFGGALGGPIIRDLMHFFVTYEGKRQQVPVDITPGNTNNTANIPASFQPEFGSFNRKFNEDLYFGKIDLVPSTADLFEASGKIRKESGQGLNSGSSFRSTSIDSKVDETRGTLRWQHTGAGWINDLKATYENVRWAPTPRVFANGSIYHDAGGATIFRSGGGANFQNKGQKGWGIQNDFTVTKFAHHTFKAGVKAKWVTLRSLQLNNFNPAYDYNTQYNGATFNTTIPYRVQFGFDSGLGGDPNVRSKNFQLGLYLQDDWDVNSHLTINYGLRWDYDRTPDYVNFVTSPASLAAVSPAKYPNIVNTNYNINDYISTGSNRKTFAGAFQPRIGFSYSFGDDKKYVLFGGYGRSYDRNQFDFIQQEAQVGSYSTRTFNFLVPGDKLNNCKPSPTCVAWDPIYLTQAGLAKLVATVGPLGGSELRFINNKLKVPYSDQFSLGVRGRFGLWRGEVGYSHVKSRDGFVWLLGNRRPDGTFFAPGTTEGPPFSFTPPGRGSLILGDNGLKTTADTVYLKIGKRYTHSSPWDFDATYTFTKATENRQFGQVFSLDFPSINDYPTFASQGVPKHRLVAAGSVDVPFGLTLSGKLTLASPPYVMGRGFPGDPVGNRQLRVIEANNKQPFIIGDLWAQRQIDLAVTKYLPLQFLTKGTRVWIRADVLNVLNEANYTQYNTNGTDNDPRPLLDKHNLPIFYPPGTPAANGLFGDISGYSMGGNPPRTFKISAGFSF